MARRWESPRAYLIGGRVIYLVLWIYGPVVDKDSDANFVPLNAADDWLHLVLGPGMTAVEVILQRERAGRSSAV